MPVTLYPSRILLRWLRCIPCKWGCLSRRIKKVCKRRRAIDDQGFEVSNSIWNFLEGDVIPAKTAVNSTPSAAMVKYNHGIYVYVYVYIEDVSPLSRAFIDISPSSSPWNTYFTTASLHHLPYIALSLRLILFSGLFFFFPYSNFFPLII